jgi:uncharacterized Tic20 family protein
MLCHFSALLIFVGIPFSNILAPLYHMAHQKRGNAFCGRSGKRSAEFPDQHDNIFTNFWDIVFYINWNSFRYWIGNI